ncbi:DUF2510 domain-containing protein [Leucobacter sp. gxy201]|uniref:DUF2510 domain-containing protein n=1 Tax=Leucobacter sp. gxy201 TaxID=2957200 RepID=UPI003DA1AB0C
MNSVQPGWYPDDTGTLRWWDGRQWTEHTHTPEPEVAAAQQVTTPQVPQMQVPQALQAQQPQAQSTAPQGAQALQGSPTPKLRHAGVAWAIAGAVALGVVGSGIAFGMSLATHSPAEAGGAETAPGQSSEEGEGGGRFAPLVERTPVDAEQAKRLEFVVRQFNEAYEKQDCALYDASTSAALREERGECSPEMFDGLTVTDYRSTTLEASQARDGLYDLRVEESYTYNGQAVEGRLAYILVDDPETGEPVIEMIIDRN